MQSGVIKQSRDTIPLMTTCVCAGFPSPAQDYMETDINLHDYLIPHPLSTFLLKVVNDSMEPLIPANALLIVDKALKAKHNDIIVGFLSGEFTLKRLFKKDKIVILKPENPKYRAITITEETDFTIWGVVTQIIINPKKIK